MGKLTLSIRWFSQTVPHENNWKLCVKALTEPSDCIWLLTAAHQIWYDEALSLTQHVMRSIS